MADYFTNFSLIMQLPDEAAQQYALDLAHQAHAVMLGDESTENFPAPLVESAEDWQFDTDPSHSGEGWAIWLHSSCGGIEAVCAFIQHLLQKFDPQGRVTFEWSNDCSQPRVDAYGGGAAIVTTQEIKSINTAGWLHQHAA